MPSTFVPPDLALTIPIRYPCASNNAPPELPPLTEASVCNKVITIPSMETSLDIPEIIPFVTEMPAPKALPIGVASSPNTMGASSVFLKVA